MQSVNNIMKRRKGEKNGRDTVKEGYSEGETVKERHSEGETQ